MDKNNLHTNENAVLRSAEAYNNLDVISMDRNQLLQFLYYYIQKNQYLNKRYSLIKARVAENDSKRLKRIEELKSKFNAFYDNNLKTNQINIEEKIKKIETFQAT